MHIHRGSKPKWTPPPRLHDRQSTPPQRLHATSTIASPDAIYGRRCPRRHLTPPPRSPPPTRHLTPTPRSPPPTPSAADAAPDATSRRRHLPPTPAHADAPDSDCPDAICGRRRRPRRHVATDAICHQRHRAVVPPGRP
nr:extensin-like [Aegilops tauschii subsp. strangulata]